MTSQRMFPLVNNAIIDSSCFLQYFDSLCKAPNAIPRLRQFILDLAIRGKLIQQDLNDEPASDLLKRIQSKKATLAESGEYVKKRTCPALIKEEFPFCIPDNWCWSQLAEIGFLNPRNMKADDLTASFVPMTMISTDYGFPNTHEIRPWREIKNGYTHFAEGDVALAKITPCFENGKSTIFRKLTGGFGAGTTELHVIRPVIISAEYVLIFLKSPHFIETGIPKMTGTAGQKRVSTDYFAFSPFPLPPLLEQHRIVAKVKELMGLCDQLDDAQLMRESYRNKLAKASLQRLNKPPLNTIKSLSFHCDVDFHLCNFLHFTTNPDQIRQLRDWILNLAVRGQLLPQDLHDEPASVLLNRINEEKAQLVKEGTLRKPEPSLRIADKKVLFQIPANWCWAFLSNLSRRIQYGFTASADHSIKDVRLLRISDIQNNSVDWLSVPGCEIAVQDVAQYKLEEGDILIARTGGTIGKTFLVTQMPVTMVFASYLIRIQRSSHIYDQYLKLFFESPVYWQQLLDGAKGTGQPNVNGKTLGQMNITLPPLAEQHRIVSKVNELMELCDELQNQLLVGIDRSSQLLEVILRSIKYNSDQS